MRKLILFDVDGTLLKSAGKSLHNAAFFNTLKNLHDIELETKERSMSGLTDRIILTLLLQEGGMSDSEIEKHLPGTLIAVQDFYVKEFKTGSVVILPGVKELLQALKERGSTIGLLTGNIEGIAHTKLKSLGINDYFTTGGFGHEPHTSRGELVKLAIVKAGFKGNEADVYLVGDTPRDIRAAQEAGLSHIVAVATGSYTSKELRGCGAEVTLDDFSDKQTALSAFGY